MRFPLSSLAVLMFFYACQPTEFEGKVVYKQQVISKNSAVDEDLYNQIFGDTLTWTYKRGNYIEENNGSGSPKIVYLQSEKSTFTVLPDSLYRRDVTLEEKRLDTLYFSGRQTMILDHNCRELIKVIKGVNHRFWVTDKLRINPESYIVYKLAHTNRQYSLAPFHYLRYEYESAVFKIVREAISIDYSHVAPSFFELPKQGSLNR